MKCWFKRDPKGEWATGLIVDYIGALGSTAAAVVKVDKRGELLSLPLAQVSYGDLKPEEGHEHYKDPRYPDMVAPLAQPQVQAVATRAFKEAGGR